MFGVIEKDAMYDPQAFASSREWFFWAFGVFPMFGKVVRPTDKTSAHFLVIFTIINIYYPGKVFPKEYTRFKFDTKKLEKKLLEEATWPPAISNPIHREHSNSSSDPKGFEVTMVEMQPHPGSKV